MVYHLSPPNVVMITIIPKSGPLASSVRSDEKGLRFNAITCRSICFWVYFGSVRKDDVRRAEISGYGLMRAVEPIHISLAIVVP